MTRTGKIARLPYGLRKELNHQIRNGQPGVEIVAWLNGTKEGRQVVGRHFEGLPISEQNLTDWKAGGYQEWERHMETREWMKDLLGESDELSDDAERNDPWNSVADRLSAPLAVQLARSLKEISAAPEVSALDRLNAILAISQATAQLRRSDHSRKRLAWQAEWKERDCEQAEQARQEKEERAAQKTQMFQAMYQQQEAAHAERMAAMLREAEAAKAARANAPSASVPKTPQALVPATAPSSRNGGQLRKEDVESRGEGQGHGPDFPGKSGQIRVNQPCAAVPPLRETSEPSAPLPVPNQSTSWHEEKGPLMDPDRHWPSASAFLPQVPASGSLPA